MNLADVLTGHAERDPAAPAIVEPGRTIDYAALDRAVWRAAASFRHRGIGPGDVVGLAMGSTALHLVASYALARAGAVQIALPAADPASADLERRFSVKTVLREGDEDWLAAAGPAIDPAVRASGGDAGWRIVTTPAPGRPKAVLHTHAMHAAAFASYQAADPLLASDRCLDVLGLHTQAGLLLCWHAQCAGAALLLGFPKATAGEFFRSAESQRATFLFLLPMHLQGLLPALPRERPRLPGVRKLRTGGMIVPEALRRETVRRLTPNLTVVYATNDIGALIAFASGSTLERFPDALGVAAPGVAIEIAGVDGNALPSGEVGLVRVRAPGMPQGYLDDPEASARAFRDGWYYPGDLGSLAPEGALYFKGRADDMMNVDGLKVYPAEIESALLAHGAVAEAAAFAVPSTKHQDVPAAAVVLRESGAARELEEWCRERLGARGPKLVIAVPRLPRDAAGRPDRGALVRLARERGANGG